MKAQKKFNLLVKKATRKQLEGFAFEILCTMYEDDATHDFDADKELDSETISQLCYAVNSFFGKELEQ